MREISTVDSDLPTEEELIDSLRDGERDPIEDADEVKRVSKYSINYIHHAQEANVGISFKYTGGFTDHGGALEPYEATVLTPGPSDDAMTYVQ